MAVIDSLLVRQVVKCVVLLLVGVIHGDKALEGLKKGELILQVFLLTELAQESVMELLLGNHLVKGELLESLYGIKDLCLQVTWSRVALKSQRGALASVGVLLEDGLVKLKLLQ